jgi:hypothetical protein
MAQRFVVTETELVNYGHKRLVHLLDTRSGEEFTLTYGTSITEQQARRTAPGIVEKQKPKKRRYEQ